MVAKDGVEEKRKPGCGKEFGVGCALICGVESVGVRDVDRCGDERCVGCGKAACGVEERDTSGTECQPGVGDGSPRPRENSSEEGADRPGEWRVEDEAWLAGIPCGSVGPVWVEIAVAKLFESLEPVDEVKVVVVAAGGASDDERKNGDERGYQDEEIGASIAHLLRVPQPWKRSRSLHYATVDNTARCFCRDDTVSLNGSLSRSAFR